MALRNITSGGSAALQRKYFSGTVEMLIALCQRGALSCSNGFEEELATDNISGVSHPDDGTQALKQFALADVAGGIWGIGGLRGAGGEDEGVPEESGTLPPLRLAYIAEVESLEDTATAMSAAGESDETIARTVHGMRREIGIKIQESNTAADA